MLLSGLTSDTFPKLTSRRIVEIAQAAGIEGIEWEAGSHVPIGDRDAAMQARTVTEEAGMVVISYGVDEPIEEGATIERIVATAGTLGSAAIRVRAGSVPRSEASEQERTATAAALASCVEQAGRQGILVAVTLHPGSHAADGREALELMNAANVETGHVFWRPQNPGEVDTDIEDLRAVEDIVLGVHCSGLEDSTDSTMLSEVTDRWARYLEVLRRIDDDHWLCLRGVEGHRVDAFYRDAHTLRRLAARFGGSEPAP